MNDNGYVKTLIIKRLPNYRICRYIYDNDLEGIIEISKRLFNKMLVPFKVIYIKVKKVKENDV